MRIHSNWVATAVAGILVSVGIPGFGDQTLPSQPYVWKSVQMVGGGFVDGIIFHPTERGLRYARTDIGGAYRWDDQQHIWIPILDWVPFKDTNLMGVESIAVDPADPDRVYLACGMYTNATSPNAAILRSDDRGNTFERTDVPFKMGGNEDGRGNGERLAVDPNDGSVIYFGSRLAGLWRSTDRAVTWSKVASFPNVTEGSATRPTTRSANSGFGRRRFGFFARSSGIDFVIFDPAHGRKWGAERDDLCRGFANESAEHFPQHGCGTDVAARAGPADGAAAVAWGVGVQRGDVLLLRERARADPDE